MINKVSFDWNFQITKKHILCVTHHKSPGFGLFRLPLIK